MDRSEPLMKADLVGKKTGYPQLWRTVKGDFSERETPEPNDGLVNTLKWNEVTGHTENDDA